MYEGQNSIANALLPSQAYCGQERYHTLYAQRLQCGTDDLDKHILPANIIRWVVFERNYAGLLYDFTRMTNPTMT